MTNKTRNLAKREDVELIDPVLNTSVSGSAVQDDDTFASPSATKLASSESIKAYVDANSGGGSITVQEEGSSLSTGATTLNFVGSGVTASGTGATKTITISGGGSSNLPITTTVGSYTHTINAPSSLFENSTVTFPKTKDPDAQVLVRQTFRSSSIIVDFEGDRASQYTGYNATIMGYHAGNNLTSGANGNTAIGSEALGDNVDGDNNVAIGYYAGHEHTTSSNVSIGYRANSDNVAGSYNVSIGHDANKYNNYGDDNVAIGRYALSNSSANGADYNICIGNNSGKFIWSGNENICIGHDNTPWYTTSNQNTTLGGKVRVGFRRNVGIGYNSGYGIGGQSDYCTHVGYYSGYDMNGGDYLTGVGGYTNRYSITGSFNCSLGYSANPSSTSSSGQMTLGDYNISNLRCNDTSISGLSDERDKTNITTIPFGLDFINDLKPVTFKWQRRDGSKGTHSEVCGFIAQDLYETEIKHGSTSKTHLVDWDNPDKLETSDMRTYPILVKAVQELSQKIDELQKEIAELKGD